MLVDIPKVSQEIIDNNYLTHTKFESYLKEKGIEESYWANIISDILIKLKDQNEKNLLLDTIRENINQLASSIDNFTSLLELIANEYNRFDKTHYLVVYLDIDLEGMKNLYHKINLSDKSIIKKVSGTVLGLIGRRSPRLTTFNLRNLAICIKAIFPSTKITLIVFSNILFLILDIMNNLCVRGAHFR